MTRQRRIVQCCDRVAGLLLELALQVLIVRNRLAEERAVADFVDRLQHVKGKDRD